MGKAKQTLFELIEGRLVDGADIAAIDEKIWAMFGEHWAILCSDMTGFTRRTDEFGIIHFLSLIHEMQKLMKPVLLAHNGLLMKTEADNLFVIFRDPAQAVRCALAMHHASELYNQTKTPDYQVRVCIGIGYGRVLKLGDEDCFGSEVNRAFKLGEDIARGGQTLLTPDAYAAAQSLLPELQFENITTDMTGLVNNYYLVKTAN